MLSDPKKRREYDAGGFAGVAGFTPQDLFGGVDFDDLLHGMGTDFGNFNLGGGGLFDRFFGHHHRRPPRGEDIELNLAIPLALIASGGEHTVHVTRPVTCATCAGSGAKMGTLPRDCANCHGSGRTVETRQEEGVSIRHSSPCAACQGRGRVIDEPCTDCSGAGRVPREESLVVTIPAGIDDGTALRVPGHGMPHPQTGAPPGDLLVVVHSAPDPRFERDGGNLWRTEQLAIAEAVLGAERDVPTLGASAKVQIPAGTQPDSVLRLRGKGLPRFGGGPPGDLLLRLQLVVPTALAPEERQLYQRLRELQGGGQPPRRGIFADKNQAEPERSAP